MKLQVTALWIQVHTVGFHQLNCLAWYRIESNCITDLFYSRVNCNSKIFSSEKVLNIISGLNPYSWEGWFDWLRRPSNQYQLKCSKWKRLELDTCIKYHSSKPDKLETVASENRMFNDLEDIRRVGLRVSESDCN